MPTTGYVCAPRYLEHDTGPYHPERSDRLRAIQERLEKYGVLSMLERIDAVPVDLETLERVHSPTYIQRLKAACERGETAIDTPDCAISGKTYEAALLAAGGVVQAIDAVMVGQIHNAFCAVRPPGHHAERSSAMGFCYFNNIAVGAEYLRTRHGLRRLAIFDWDVHHGNGTQHHFEADPSVLFCSIHQDPSSIFPGTGFADEQGDGAGVGTTINVPMRPGSGDEDYKSAVRDVILPAIAAFEPEFILVSAGFDPHREDPLAQILLSTSMFEWMTREVAHAACRSCEGRLVSVLEGGYSLRALAESVQAHVEALGTACP